MKDKELSIELIKWFKEYYGFEFKWCRTHTGKVMKEQLDKLGNWKNQPRGNPSKGRKAAIENKFRAENSG